MRLKDKVAIVTGAGHGMGEAEARLFAAEGAKVIVADILENEAERIAGDIRRANGDAIAAKIDVTSEPEWVALISKTVSTYGRLDILVNNAGISGSSVGDPNGLEGWNRLIAVNQTSVFIGTKLAAEQMAKTGGGSIVNISSIMGFVGSAGGHPAYHASKGAVRIYSKAAAVRYGPMGVRVNTVHPGYMPPMLNATNAGERDEKIALTPLRRIGQPIEVAGLVSRLRRSLVCNRRRTRHRRRLHCAIARGFLSCCPVRSREEAPFHPSDRRRHRPIPQKELGRRSIRPAGARGVGR